eukprot:SAG22_NODE_1633_length_3930_cov_1.860872_2_plen_209_part_00
MLRVRACMPKCNVAPVRLGLATTAPLGPVPTPLALRHDTQARHVMVRQDGCARSAAPAAVPSTELQKKEVHGWQVCHRSSGWGQQDAPLICPLDQPLRTPRRPRRWRCLGGGAFPGWLRQRRGGCSLLLSARGGGGGGGRRSAGRLNAGPVGLCELGQVDDLSWAPAIDRHWCWCWCWCCWCWCCCCCRGRGRGRGRWCCCCSCRPCR